MKAGAPEGFKVFCSLRAETGRFRRVVGQGRRGQSRSDRNEWSHAVLAPRPLLASPPAGRGFRPEGTGLSWGTPTLLDCVPYTTQSEGVFSIQTIATGGNPCRSRVCQAPKAAILVVSPNSLGNWDVPSPTAQPDPGVRRFPRRESGLGREAESRKKPRFTYEQINAWKRLIGGLRWGRRCWRGQGRRSAASKRVRLIR